MRCNVGNGLSRNTSVSYIAVEPFDGMLSGALAAALPSNTTLQFLVLSGRRSYVDPNFSLVLSALGRNTGLKDLTLGTFGSMDDSMSTAMIDGLGMNETLESLELSDCFYDFNAAVWSRALSSLSTNKFLKSLTVTMGEGASKSRVAALCGHIAAILPENSSLESLIIGRDWSSPVKFKAEEYLCLVTALRHTTTLKSFDFQGGGSFTLTDDEDKQMAALLKKNYALESLPNIEHARKVRAILRLNRAGRRYLIEDESSISKGVAVLSAVSNDINCAFLHLLENPRLCDRCAVEAASDSIDNGGPTSPVNHIESESMTGPKLKARNLVDD